jgi:hypothetical protein
MVAQQIPASTPTVNTAAWLAAFQRATAGRILVYRTPHYGCYHVTSASQAGTEYTVQTAGPRWHELVCTCPGARRGYVCLHMAAVAFARKHHVYAVRQAPAQVVEQREEVAATEQHEEVAPARAKVRQSRWCQVCLLNPVTDSFPVCAACAEDDARRAESDQHGEEVAA